MRIWASRMKLKLIIKVALRALSHEKYWPHQDQRCFSRRNMRTHSIRVSAVPNQKTHSLVAKSLPTFADGQWRFLEILPGLKFWFARLSKPPGRRVQFLIMEE